MCKLVLIPHVPKGKSKLAWKFAKTITPTMSTMDKDGFGYCAITGDDQFLAEKWLYPANAWCRTLSGEFRGLEGALSGGLDNEMYGHCGLPVDGHKRPSLKSLLLHARFSTCGGGIENTHPFVLEDNTGPYAALVHNGVVNPRKLSLEQSTCDSEGILNALRDCDVWNEPANLQAALDEVEGYYALGVLAQTYEHGWIVDIIKDATASLSACFVYELGAAVYTTTAMHVLEACKELKWRKPRVARMRDNTRIRYVVSTGAVLFIDHFKPTERTYYGEGYGYPPRALVPQEVTKYNTYVGEAADVQAVLARMEADDRGTRGTDVWDANNIVDKSAGIGNIDTVTGAVTLPGGEVIEIAGIEDEGSSS